jgi:hypothetical protein
MSHSLRMSKLKFIGTCRIQYTVTRYIFSDKIQYDDPKTLEETIRHTKFFYDQQRGRSNFQKDWEEKMKSKVEQRKKGAKP